jgi:hypothetical protein
LLTKTEDISAADWTKTNTTAATASSLLETAATGAHSCVQTVTTAATGQVYSIQLKANGRTRFAIGGNASFGGNLGAGVFFDLATGSYVSGAAVGAVPLITPLDDGWYQVSYTWTSLAGTGVIGIFLVDSGTNLSYTGDVTKGMFIRKADLRPTNQGVNLPAYQRVNTSTDYDSTGFPVYIKPNGSNQFMQTNSINFTATDKMTLWAGVRKLSDATAIIAETSNDANSNNGSFFAYQLSAAGLRYGSRGTSTSIATFNNTAPITNVLTALSDIAGDLTTLRLNGAQVATSTADQGTGNYGNYPAYFYMRAGTAFPFNGHDYGSIARGAASTAAQIANGEAYINSKTKAYTP